jgi:hypothetical protein
MPCAKTRNALIVSDNVEIDPAGVYK